MERNLRLLFALQICMGCQFFLPVFFIFLRNNGLSWSDVFSLEAIFTVAIMLFQIPAGMLADRFGSKKVLIAGFVAGAISFIIHANADTFSWFAVGNVLLALLVACHAAGFETMTYATLSELGRTADFRQTLGRLVFVSLLGLGLTGVIGGLVAISSLRLTLWLTFPAFAVGACLATQLVQPKIERVKHVTLPEALSAICEGGWTLRTVMLVNITFLTAVNVLGWLSQPYQLSIGAPEWMIGLVQAFSLILASITARCTHQLERKIDDRLLLGGTVILIALSLGGMAMVGGYVGIVLLVLGRGCFGAVSTLGSDLLHRLIDDRIRSRVQALQGAIMRAVMALTTLGIGAMMESGLSAVLPTAFGVVTVAMSVTLFFLSAAWPADTP